MIIFIFVEIFADACFYKKKLLKNRKKVIQILKFSTFNFFTTVLFEKKIVIDLYFCVKIKT